MYLHRSSDDTLLSVGQWSDRGCVRSEALSNNSFTVCECNHLTHFTLFLNGTDTVAITTTMEVPTLSVPELLVIEAEAKARAAVSAKVALNLKLWGDH